MGEANTPNADRRPFWAFSIEETYRELDTQSHGLTGAEAARRLKKFGPNAITQDGRITQVAILINQLKNPLIFMLLIAGGITIFLEEYKDAIVILAAVVVNTVLGFYQENKAETAIAKLKSYLTEHIRVIRDGKEREIETTTLAPGDVIRIRQGDRVPADARLTHENELSIDEAILTGESLPEHKQTTPTSVNAELGDRTSMIFGGTLVMAGTGTAVVCETGAQTEIGRIAALVGSTRKEETPLQRNIRRFTLQASAVLVALTIVVFIVGVRVGYSVFDMFLTSVAIAVAAVPEGLPIALTVILAISVQRLSRRNAVVRKLLAAETLGGTSVILTDKTGTLTKAEMTLARVLPIRSQATHDTSPKDLQRTLLSFALFNADVVIENEDAVPAAWRVLGRPLERALVINAVPYGVSAVDLKKDHASIASLPFNSRDKYSAAIVDYNKERLLVVLGAPDVLLDRSTRLYFDAARRGFRPTELRRTIDAMAYHGERLLGVAVQRLPKTQEKIENVEKLAFAGIISFHDPVREEAKEAFRSIEESGVRTVIVTGDHRGTAEAVARELGMEITEHMVFEGVDVRRMTDAELQTTILSARIFARVSPEDKVRIAEAYRRQGNVVAMTGDGVNDAPSLRQADIGIAMGSGSDVAKDVADMVLLDDNFATITAAIEEGKRAFGNIRKVVVYLFSNALDQLILIGGSLLIGLALPINALQILWINFFTDSFPAIALAFEEKAGTVSRRPIRGSFLDAEAKFLIFVIGIVSSALLLGLYLLLLRLSLDENVIRTFMFAVLGSYTLFLLFPIRDLKRSVFRFNPFSNLYAVIGVSIGFAMLFGGIYIPVLQDLLGTVALPPAWLVGVLAYGFLNIMGIEIGKWLFRNAEEQ